MTKSLDELIEFLLAEIALCGVRGAGSADFRRFIFNFFEQSQQKIPSEGLGRSYYSKVWDWVRRHQDVRIVCQKQPRDLSLSEFETFELQETGSNGADYVGEHSSSNAPSRPTVEASASSAALSESRSSFRNTLRQRLASEGYSPSNVGTAQVSRTQTSGTPETHTANDSDAGMIDKNASSQKMDRPKEPAVLSRGTNSSIDAIPSKTHEVQHAGLQTSRRRRGPRKVPKGVIMNKPTFDDLSSTTTAPRIYVSQNRTWQAVAGHALDLKKIPSMQFLLLSIIAAHGPNGILQPELVRLSGQDKRSVPHRTDELARNGYIEKKSVQAHKARTSLCVHRKFLTNSQSLEDPLTIESVFGNRTLVFSNFVKLLHNLLKEEPSMMIQQRELRIKLGVSMENWQPRTVRTAMLRLSQTGMIEKKAVWKKGDRESTTTIIRLLRAPNEEDIKNLRFRRQALSRIDGDGEEEDGDDLMRDLDQLTFDDETASARIMPQWVPDRSIANLTFQVLDLAGPAGLDNAAIRERTMGKFWKRPVESYLCRLTDAWEESQPAHLRHKAIIRDTTLTQEKRYVHYLYRTHVNFQHAVDDGFASWEAVSKEAAKGVSGGAKSRSKRAQQSNELDEWGFHGVSTQDFHRRDGSASLKDSRAAISVYRPRVSYWDNALSNEMGYERSETKKAEKPKKVNPFNRPRTGRTPKEVMTTEEKLANSEMRRIQMYAMDQARREGRKAARTPKKQPKTPSTKEPPLLSSEQRVALGLSTRGRLGIEVENQIREYRKQTGNPTAVPDTLAIGPRPEPILPAQEKNEVDHGETGLQNNSEQPTDSVIHQAYQDGTAMVTPKKPRRPRTEPSRKSLFTVEFRKKHNLPLKGRLKQSVVDHYRELLEDGEDLATEGDTEDPSSTPMVLPDEHLADISQIQTTEKFPDGPQPAMPITPVEETSKNNFEAANDSQPATTSKRKTDSQMSPATSPKRPRLTLDDAVTSTTSKRKADGQPPSPTSANAKRRRLTSGTLPITEDNESMDVSPLIDVQPTIELADTRTADDRVSDTFVTLPAQGTQEALNQSDSDQICTLEDGALVRPTTRGDEGVSTAMSRTGQESIQSPTSAAPAFTSLSEPLGPREPLKPHVSQVPSTFQKRVQEIVESFTLRTKPGLYINPFATRAIPRGRPKKALMAIFKLPQLQNFEWFTANSSSAFSYSPRSTPSKSSQSKKSRKKRSDAGLTRGTPKSTPVRPRQAGTPVTPNNVVNTSQLLRDGDVVSSQWEKGDAIPTKKAKIALSPTLKKTTDVPFQLPAPWNPVNARLQPSSAPYRSPYESPAATSQSPTPVVAPPRDSLALTSGSTVNLETPAPTDEEGELSIVLDLEGSEYKRKIGSLSRRGVVLGRGSVWRLRTSIVIEILQLCDGVYPFNGELTLPFYTLWDQRAPKDMAKPDRSTLIKTVNNMIVDSEYKFKKLSFRIPTPSGTAVEKFILTTKDVSPSDPRVKELRKEIIKAHPGRFFPDEIRHLIGPSEGLERPPRKKRAVPVVVDDVVLADLFPELTKKLDLRILNSAQQRRKKLVEKNKKIDENRAQLNNRVRHPLLPGDASANELPPKRQRLDTLNTGAQKRALISSLPIATKSNPKAERRAVSPTRSDTSDDTPLVLLRHRQAQLPHFMPAMHRDEPEEDGEEETSASSNDDAVGSDNSTFIPGVALDDSPTKATTSSPNVDAILFMTRFIRPSSQFDPANGTYSTVFENLEGEENASVDAAVVETVPARDSHGGIKRANIIESETEPPHKKARIDGTSSGAVRRRKRKAKQDPTLVERLTGLTGNPDDPVYVHRKRSSWRKSWNKSATRPRNREREREREQERERAQRKKVYVRQDQSDKFKMEVCTLVVASCMTGEKGAVDWNIVTKAHDSNRSFDLRKTKNLWSWIRQNMEPQVESLSSQFQSTFLDAYENGEIASIEDPETYDWAALVGWASRTCEFPDTSLPESIDALHDFFIQESTYDPFNRVEFASKRLAHASRTSMLLQYSYASAIHSQGTQLRTIDDELRARSWIRANTATPQVVYDGKAAHDKLSTLSIPILERTVLDLVDQNVLRMRKLKRLLPGRNYNFPANLALHYRAPFELDVFMDAANFKKTLDAAFRHDDPESRILRMSRATKEGAIMALFSLLSCGHVKLLPRLPPINNNIGAPGHHLSKWGFNEGDYTHRRIDRSCYFWDLDVVPTSAYLFGNPLNTAKDPLAEESWLPLADPPLPGKNENSPIPIWSNIEGNRVTWPWWYRILNIVLQVLVFQPRASAKELHKHCHENTIELFEVDLILDWLVSVHAAERHEDDTFTVLPGFWAVLGDHLKDQDDDWFGEHVRRKKTEVAPKWKNMYKIGLFPQDDDDDNDSEDDEAEQALYNRLPEEKGVRRPARVDNSRQRKAIAEAVLNADRQEKDNGGPPGSAEISAKATDAGQDVEMVDATALSTGIEGAAGYIDPYSDLDAEGEDDPDAEGEIDDEMLSFTQGSTPTNWVTQGS